MALRQEENVCLMEESQDSKGKYMVDLDGSKSVESDDIVDLLPNDPFEMDINIRLPADPFCMDIEATVVAITDWLEAYGFKTDGASEDESSDETGFFTEMDFVWAESMGQKKEVVDGGSMMDSADGSFDGLNGGEVDDLMCFGCEKYKSDDKGDYNDGDRGAPFVLQYALRYLDVWDLLSVERVCKFLRDIVREDTLLWRDIYIDDSLSYKITDESFLEISKNKKKITDDDLLRLTNRARGTLQSLTIVKGLGITNNGLKKVLQRNPGLTKLSIPGCSKLNLNTVLHDLKTFNSVAVPGIKQLRIGENCSLTNDLFKEFKLLIGADEDKTPTNFKPRFYGADEMHLSLDDERAIDVEICPRCHRASQVYDCPSESCQNLKSTNACRACICCIVRCIGCGSCLNDKPYMETFCLDFLCFDCLPHRFKCQDTSKLSPGNPCFRKMRYKFIFYS